MLFAVLTIVMTWVVVWAAIVGLGLGVHWCVCRPPMTTADRASPLILFWLGYAVVVAVVQWSHLAWPLNHWVGAALLLPGLASFLILGTGIVSSAIQEARHHPGWLAIAVILVVWMANQAAGPASAHDTGLYHLAIVQWVSDWAVLTGLGNFSVTYAHNSTHLLVAAVIDTGPWEGRSEHVLNGLIVFAMLWPVLRGVRRAVSADRDWLTVYDAALLVPVVTVALSKEISSFKTDAAPAFLVLVMGRLMIELLSESDLSPRGRRGRYLVLAILGACAVTVKLSTGMFVIAAALVACVRWMREPISARGRTFGVLASIGAGFVLIAPWMARNTIMTGYPVFPLEIAAAQVEWQVPPDQIDTLTGNVEMHGKVNLPRVSLDTLGRMTHVPGWVPRPPEDEDRLSALNWIPAWVVTVPLHSPTEVGIPLFLICMCATVVLVRRTDSPMARAPLFVAIPMALALGYWFITAPDPRYAFGLTWGATAVCVSHTLLTRFKPRSRGRWVGVLLITLPGIGAAVAWRVVEQHVRGEPMLGAVVQSVGPDHGFHPRPSVPTEPWTTTGGVTYLRPIEGTLIWDAPQPAIGWPFPDQALRWRDPTDRGAGFMIDR